MSQTQEAPSVAPFNLNFMLLEEFQCLDGEWKTCKLDGSEDFFAEMYLGQPYEMDANIFAYEQVKSLLSDSPELQALYSFWMPKESISDDVFREIYCKFDRAIEQQ